MKFISIVMPLLIVMAGCGNKQTSTEATTQHEEENIVTLTEAQLKTISLKTGRPEKRHITKTLKVTGVVEVPPQNLFSVSVPMPGYVKSTKLLRGMMLKKGEVIAVLEDVQYIQLQQNYLSVKARLEMAEADYERQKALNENKASSDKIFQQSKAEYTSLKVELGALGEKLRLIHIDPASLSEKNISSSIRLYAPFDCFVSKVNVNTGKYVNATDVLFELVNPNDIHLNLRVFEKDLSQLYVGQKLIAYTNSMPEKKYPCEVILLSQDIAPDHTSEIHCHFDQYDKNLLPGMYMNAEIELTNNESFAVPQEAVASFEGKDYLFVKVDNSRYEMTEVKTGDTEQGWVEVLNSQLFDHKEIVTQGAYALLMSIKNKSKE